MNKLGHANIIKFCGRPFNSLEEMDNTIIKNFNSRIKDNDTIFHIGDFCFKIVEGLTASDYISRLKGRHIFINGNHDNKGRNGLKTHISKIYLHMGRKDICLVHKPNHADLDVPLNLVGHVHEKWKIKLVGNSILVNVGVDVWSYRPITFNEIERFISKSRYEGLLIPSTIA